MTGGQPVPPDRTSISAAIPAAPLGDSLPETTAAGCSTAGAGVALAALLLAWYLAISVPVIVYANRLGVGKGAVRVVFAPIGWLHDRTPLRYPLRWTARLWDPSVEG
jgi:hypothetical protein